MNPIKYPRTYHLPWSPGSTSDDKIWKDCSSFEGREVVITEKMDGENTTMYRDRMHARSLDGNHHPSRDWVKSLQGQIGWSIPEGWRICGENLYARHSIVYDSLPSYFMVFGVYNDLNEALSWDDTVSFAAERGLSTVPVIWRGIWNEKAVRQISVERDRQEGYVARLADSFRYEDFMQSVAKWVRPNHVTTDTHWMHAQVVPNKVVKG